MKNIILPILIFITAHAYCQAPAATAADSVKKSNYTRKANTNHPGAVSGPYLVDPQNLKPFSDTLHVHYHNEQDNFKRPDSLPYHPAPANYDTGNHSLNENNAEDVGGSNTAANNYGLRGLSNPAINFQFDAEYCEDNDPPDNSMAISNDGFIVSAVNCGMKIYNIEGNDVLDISYQGFFNVAINNFSDPRIIYDPYSDRFIFFIQYGSTSAGSKIFVAFSETNNPKGQWWYYSFNVGANTGLAPGNWFDYPSVGLNQTDFCVTGNLFNDNGQNVSNIVLLFSKQDGYNQVPAGSLNYLYWTDVTDANNTLGFTLAPATAGQAITYADTFYLVSTQSGGGNYLTQYTIAGDATNANSTCCSAVNIGTQAYTPAAAAVEPDEISLLNTKAGCRVESAMYLNSKIVFVFTADYVTDGLDYSSIFYNQLDVADQSLSQSWSYLGGSDYNYPSLASYGTNSSDLAVILCFLKTDPVTDPQIRFKYFDNNMNQLSSTLVRAGDSFANYTWLTTGQRWGDYTTVQRRYNNQQPEAWLSGSYANSLNYWQTHIAQIEGYPGTVNISNVTLDTAQILLYPNPVQSQLYVHGDFTNFNGFPELYSIDGRLLKIDVTRKGNAMFQVDVSNLASGTYLLKFNNLQGVKFVKD